MESRPETLVVQVVETSQDQAGADHPSTLISHG